MGLRRDGGENSGQGRDEDGAVGLVDFILHGGVDQIGVGRRVGEDGGEEGETLEIEDLNLLASIV